MLRTLVVTLALALPGVAFASGGHKCPNPDKSTATTTADDAGAQDNADEAKGDKVTLTVTGMKCDDCAAKVTAALMKVDGVKAANVSYDSGKAEITFDSSKTNTKALVAAVDATGFTASAD